MVQNPAYAFLASFPSYSVTPKTLDQARSASINWNRWYANDKFVNMAVGAQNDGVVFEQNFDAATTPSGAFSGLNYFEPVSGKDYNNSDAAFIASALSKNVTMSGKWLMLGSYFTGNTNHGRFLLFDRPAAIRDTNPDYWAIEFTCTFGLQGTTTSEPLVDFVIFDGTGSGQASPTQDVTNAPWYSFGIRRKCYNGFDNNDGKGYEGNGIFCERHTGYTATGWLIGTDTLNGNHQYRSPVTGGDFGINEKFLVRFERYGNRIAMYINGSQVQHYSYITTSNTNYKIGFHAGRGWVGIDDIKMYALQPDGYAYAGSESVGLANTGFYQEFNLDYSAVQVD